MDLDEDGLPLDWGIDDLVADATTAAQAELEGAEPTEGKTDKQAFNEVINEVINKHLKEGFKKKGIESKDGNTSMVMKWGKTIPKQRREGKAAAKAAPTAGGIPASEISE